MTRTNAPMNNRVILFREPIRLFANFLPLSLSFRNSTQNSNLVTLGFSLLRFFAVGRCRNMRPINSYSFDSVHIFSRARQFVSSADFPSPLQCSAIFVSNRREKEIPFIEKWGRLPSIRYFFRERERASHVLDSSKRFTAADLSAAIFETKVTSRPRFRELRRQPA